jgi:hypothetical protein
MSSSVKEPKDENLNEFQALFMSLPKSTQQQLLGQVIGTIPGLKKESSPSATLSQQLASEAKCESLTSKGSSSTVRTAKVRPIIVSRFQQAC